MQYLLAYTVMFNQKVYDDPAWALEAATEAEVAETGGLDRYIESGVFPTDHGLSEEALDLTVQGLIDAELIEADGAPSGADMYDPSIWEDAQGLLDG
jgi:hypothetical protein